MGRDTLSVMGAPADGPHVVIIGGFLTEALSFAPMRDRLLERGAARVTITPLHWPDWLAMGIVGMGPVMLRGARAIRETRRDATAPLIVVGHSAGGLIARLAMAPRADRRTLRRCLATTWAAWSRWAPPTGSTRPSPAGAMPACARPSSWSA